MVAPSASVCTRRKVKGTLESVPSRYFAPSKVTLTGSGFSGACHTA